MEVARSNGTITSTCNGFVGKVLHRLLLKLKESQRNTRPYRFSNGGFKLERDFYSERIHKNKYDLDE
jgi:hypothetical protein